MAARQVARFCAAQVLDADVAGDRPYIVSEYVQGPSLLRLVREQGPVSGAALERLAIGTATALVAIHQAGIVRLGRHSGPGQWASTRRRPLGGHRCFRSSRRRNTPFRHRCFSPHDLGPRRGAGFRRRRVRVLRRPGRRGGGGGAAGDSRLREGPGQWGTSGTTSPGPQAEVPSLNQNSVPTGSGTRSPRAASTRPTHTAPAKTRPTISHGTPKYNTDPTPTPTWTPTPLPTWTPPPTPDTPPETSWDSGGEEGVRVVLRIGTVRRLARYRVIVELSS
jgi:hypothetical protein